MPDESPPTHSAKRNKTKPQRKKEEGAASKKAALSPSPLSLSSHAHVRMSPTFGAKNAAARMFEINR